MPKELKLTMKTALTQVLAPQMLESLNILATPILDIKNKVDEELVKNPLLEVDDSHPSESAEEEPEFDSQRMRDYFENMNFGGASYRTSSPDAEESRQYFFDSLHSEQTLQGYLLEQVAIADVSEEVRETLQTLIGFIDDQGYLHAKRSELIFSTNCSPESIEQALDVIHTSFEPAGVGAFDLRECLLIQIERNGNKGSLEWKIVDKYLQLLGNKKILELSKILGVTVDELKDAVKKITSLEPKPGREFLSDSNIYITPEVKVVKKGNHYEIEMNDDFLPKLRINRVYKELMGSSDSKETMEYIQEKIRAGKLFITSLEQRQRTIRKVAEAILEYQTEFMEKGPSALRPLNMAQIAQTAGIHETTVSRAVVGKYMETPQGIFEMRYFFSAGIRSESGESVSNKKVKDILRKIVSKEDKKRPYSDQKIVKLFEEQGIMLARRTVAKYREDLGILPSHMRKATE